MLATRHDVRLGLHRLRLEGELTEIRADDLRFSLAEARELFAAAGVELTGQALALLVDRTEGWAAGLRLAALSLAGHPDPERFAAEFSGSERTVAEYLLAEVLDRQSEEVRRLLLRTSVLERVNGELADLLTGGSGGERILQDLEEANAFVVSLDAARSWFRYHHLFAGLLQLELRRTAPGEVAALHERAAAAGLPEHGFPVEAIRHAQAARDWGLAARLLADHWPGLYLGGQAATTHELLAGFPAEARAADAELAALAAADELAQGSLEAAERYLALAERGVGVGTGRTGAGRRRCCSGWSGCCWPGSAATCRRWPRRRSGCRPLAEAPDAAQPGLGEELRALALISLGIAEFWAARFEEAERHLEQGVALARRIGRPYPRVHRPGVPGGDRDAPVACRGRRSAAGRRSSWPSGTAGPTSRPPAYAYVILGAVLAWQGRLDEAAPWVQRAERTIRAEAEPAAAMAVYYVRGLLELARGRDADALAAFRAAERLAGHLAAPHLLVPAGARIPACTPWCGSARPAAPSRSSPASANRTATAGRSASPRRCCGSPRTTRARRPPRSRRSWTAPPRWSGGSWLVEAFMLEAIARDALGDPAAAARAVERALDLAEPDGALAPFLLYPAPGLLERHTRQRTAHACPARPRSSTCWPGTDARAGTGRAAAAARAAQRQ